MKCLYMLHNKFKFKVWINFIIKVLFAFNTLFVSKHIINLCCFSASKSPAASIAMETVEILVGEDLQFSNDKKYKKGKCAGVYFD